MSAMLASLCLISADSKYQFLTLRSLILFINVSLSIKVWSMFIWNTKLFFSRVHVFVHVSVHMFCPELFCVRGVLVCNFQLCVLSCSFVQFLHSKHPFSLSLQRDSGPSQYLLLRFHQLMSLSERHAHSTAEYSVTHMCTHTHTVLQMSVYVQKQLYMLHT